MKSWTTQIDKITHGFTESFDSLLPEQMNWKPHSDTWSIAQNIDHLITINETYFPIIPSIRNQTQNLPFIAKISFLVSLSGKTVLKSVQPDRKKKIKTFPIWEPGNSNIPDNILNKFEDHQSKLKALIENSNDLIQAGKIISSPANKYIVYKLETAFDIIVAHERRHFKQAKEVLQMMANNPI